MKEKCQKFKIQAWVVTLITGPNFQMQLRLPYDGIYHFDNRTGKYNFAKIYDFSPHDGDLLVCHEDVWVKSRREDGSLYERNIRHYHLWRYDAQKLNFVKCPCGSVHAYEFCPLGFVVMPNRDKAEWLFYDAQKLGDAQFIGRSKLCENVFVSRVKDGTLSVCFWQSKNLVQRLWLSSNWFEFMLHKGCFVVGERLDGLYDVLTASGRLFRPRRACFLKQDDGPFDDIRIFAWIAQKQAFKLLYHGPDVLNGKAGNVRTPWLNTYGVFNRNGKYELHAFGAKSYLHYLLPKNSQPRHYLGHEKLLLPFVE